MRTARAAATLLAGLLVLGALTTLAPPAATAAPDEPERRDRVGHRVGDLADDTVIRPGADAAQRYRARKWPGRKIRFHETIPAKWDWSLDRAIEHWNDAGGRIRFVRSGKAAAQLRIGYGATGGADGVATVGYQRRNYVHLATRYRRADEHDPATRVWVGRLLTHELGHVLGFEHTRGQCSLMYPIYDFGLCPPLPSDAPGHYQCRWIDKALLRRFIRMYGGRAQRPPARCLIEALPPQLEGVEFGGGADEGAPVRIRWQPPGRVRAGTRVWVTVWRAESCDREPKAWERRVGVDPGAGSWTEAEPGRGTWCYQVQIVNRYGGARAPFARAMQRWAPDPAPPDVAEPTWHTGEGAWRFTWRAPAGTTLAAVRDGEDPASCADPGEGDRSELERRGADRWVLYATGPTECVLLVAVTDWGAVSAGTEFRVQVPPPSAAPSVGSLTVDGEVGLARAAVGPLEDHLRLGIEVVAGTCPSQPPPDAGWWDGWEESPGTWVLYLEGDGTGPQCAIFTALDGFEQHGPVVMRAFATG